MSDERRRQAERTGRRAEFVALLAYQLRGYQILARRFRAAGGEIDIVARRGNTLVLVEVKSRRNHDAAISAVTPAARRRIEHAGRSFLARSPSLAALDLRYDIAVVRGLEIRLLRDAWRAP